MSYQVLARKWRPRSFGTMVGQEHVLRALINALDNDRLHHAYLFTGTRGVGKTTVSRIFAKSLNCEQGVTSQPCGQCSACREIDEGRFVDLIEVDAASRTKVEDTRELLENVQYVPTRGRYKVYLIDEVHMLSTHSFNALLKTLEEPPPHVKFLLATTDPQKLPVTILSRCLQFNLKRLSPEMIAGHLHFLLGEEKVEFEPAAVEQISVAADGSMRDALSLLDQAIAYGGGRLTDAEVRAMLGTVDRSHVYRLLQGLADRSADAMLATVDELAQQGVDFTAVLAEFVSQLHKLALAQVAPAALADAPDRQTIEGLAAAISAEDVQLYYQIALNGRRDLPFAPEPRGGFEMILLRMLAFTPLSLADLAAPAPVQPPSRPDPAPQRPAAPQAPQAVPQRPSPSASPFASLREAVGAPAKGPAKGQTQSQAQSQPQSQPQPKPQPTPRAQAVAPQRQPQAAAVAVAYEDEVPPPWLEEGPPPFPDESLSAQPVPARVAEPAAAEPVSAPRVGAETSDWHDIVSSLGLQGMASQLAANSVLTRKEGNTLHLSLSAQHATLRSKMMEQRLQEALSGYYGEPVNLMFEVGELDAETPAHIQARQAQDRQQAAMDAIHADPNVRRICETFDGEVLTETVRPVD